MSHIRYSFTPAVMAACLALWAGPGFAADGQKDNFNGWLEGFKQDTAAQGISQKTVASALNGVAYDPVVITRDHSQSVFQQSFEQFSGRMISPDRLRKGANMLKRYWSILERIEQRYGVQGPVLVAIWGLESDYGVNQGKFSTIRSLATLAYDCRRSEKFRAELSDALRIIERGDLTSSEMIGAWAGEIGQTQLLPSSYLRFAVDFDGYGRRDLIHSPLTRSLRRQTISKVTAGRVTSHGRQARPTLVLCRSGTSSEVYAKAVAYFATRLEKEP